jgi:hypothetical protein
MIKKALALLGKNKNLHGQFINTLSVLEFAGARKIIKSQRAENLDSEILSHISEEIRHARVLKNIALKMSEGKLKTYMPKHLLAGDAAWSYIQTVDHSIELEFTEPQPWLNYLYTTLLIEERAMEVYPLYSETLKEYGFASSLQGMILEEENHLNFTRKHILESDPQSSKRLEKFRKIEMEAFEKFMSSVCFELSILNNKNSSQDHDGSQQI